MNARLLLLVVVLAVILTFGFMYDNQGGSLSNNPFTKQMADAVKARYGDLAHSVALNFTVVQEADLLAIACRETGSYIMQGKTSADISGDNGDSIGICQIDVKYHPEYSVQYLRDDENNMIACATILEADILQHNLDRQAGYGEYNGAGRSSDYATVCMNYYNYFSVGSLPNA